MSKEEAGNDLLIEAGIRRELKDDYRKVFLGSKEGRKVLTDLLQYCGVLRPIIEIDNERQTIFNSGKQDVGLLLLDLVDKSGYDAIIELEKEGAKLTQIGEQDYD